MLLHVTIQLEQKKHGQPRVGICFLTYHDEGQKSPATSCCKCAKSLQQSSWRMVSCLPACWGKQAFAVTCTTLLICPMLNVSQCRVYSSCSQRQSPNWTMCFFLKLEVLFILITCVSVQGKSDISCMSWTDEAMLQSQQLWPRGTELFLHHWEGFLPVPPAEETLPPRWSSCETWHKYENNTNTMLYIDTPFRSKQFKTQQLCVCISHMSESAAESLTYASLLKSYVSAYIAI